MATTPRYGWFQWYCRFFQGRRSEDDERQIQRWLKICGPTGWGCGPTGWSKTKVIVSLQDLGLWDPFQTG